MKRRQFLASLPTASLLGACVARGSTREVATLPAIENIPDPVGGPLDLFTVKYFGQAFTFPATSGRRFELKGDRSPAPVPYDGGALSWVSLSGYAPTVETLVADRQRKLQQLAASLLAYSAKPTFTFPFFGLRTEESKMIGFRHLLGQQTKFARTEKLLFACGSPATLVWTLKHDHRVKLVSGRPKGDPKRYMWLMECSMVVYDGNAIGVS